MALHPDGRIEVAAERGGLPFGIDENTDYGCINLDLGPEPTTLFFYTDGLNEALNEQEEEFGIDRIHETLRSHASDPPQELLKNMRQAVSDFSGDVPQGDDITLLAIRTSGNSKIT
jgi:serine phosphatase RsbU (regulator of sigma subunit)